MKLTTLDIRGKKFDVEVSEQGDFFTVIDGEVIKAPALDSLRTRLLSRSRRETLSLSIPFVSWDETESRIRRGVCTGKHANNRNLLVKWDGQKGSEQVSSWELNENAIDTAFADEYGKLCLALKAAKKGKDRFEKAHRVDIARLVDAALIGAGVMEGER